MPLATDFFSLLFLFFSLPEHSEEAALLISLRAVSLGKRGCQREVRYLLTGFKEDIIFRLGNTLPLVASLSIRLSRR